MPSDDVFFQAIRRVLHDPESTPADRAMEAIRMLAENLGCARVVTKDLGKGRYLLTITIEKPN